MMRGTPHKISCILIVAFCWAAPVPWQQQTVFHVEDSYGESVKTLAEENSALIKKEETDPSKKAQDQIVTLPEKYRDEQSVLLEQKKQKAVPKPNLAPKFKDAENRAKANDSMLPERRSRPQISKPILKPRNERPAETLSGETPKIRKNGIMGLAELQFKDIDKIQDFALVRHGLVADMSTLKQCLTRLCEAGVEPFVSRLRAVSGLSDIELLGSVNALVNEMPYRSDRSQWGKTDHWARPLDSLNRGGDCEDYALLKFAALTALGFDEKDMRFVIGYTREGVAHVNLNVKTKHGDIFLDNRFNDVRPESRTDIVPRYSVNLSARWTHLKTGEKTLKYASAAQ